MSYKDSADYKAFRLKLDYLKKELSGQYDHALSKLGMFAEDAFSTQQATIDRLQRENSEWQQIFSEGKTP